MSGKRIAPGKPLFTDPSQNGIEYSISAETLQVPDGAPGENRRSGQYSAFYRALSELREEFHRIGRFDDANAKLEEMCKLLILAELDRRHPLSNGNSRLSRDRLQERAIRCAGTPNAMAAAMHAVYDELVAAFPEEFAGFGGRPGLTMEKDDDAFASALLPLLSSFPAASSANGPHWSFDGINEAFGHFIQDSFRNRKEDAQYMTPPEVVSPMVTIALRDILADPEWGLAESRPLRVADPTCGVGSFLAAAYRVGLSINTSSGRLADRLQLIGQDKVDRMVRLANVNLRLFACTNASIRTGNSILPPEGLSDLSDSIDLVVTNPPFGAEFSSERILAESSALQQPVLHHLARSRNLPSVIGSEYILLDRELTILRPGGRLLMVVPDHVVSGAGFAAHFRSALREYADLEAVFGLPTETFAQAGTRTKTSVVYLRRKAVSGKRKHFVIMATAEDLGFRVKSRSGATIKQIVGRNDMEDIAEIVERFRGQYAPIADIECLSACPSVALVAETEILGNSWNAGFYRPERLLALKALKQLASMGVRPTALDEVAIIDPPDSIRARAENGYLCISVLHVRQDGLIDLEEARSYRPTTPCVRCQAGDVLLSRINPRIIRICIVPELDQPVACSAEFAILRPRQGSDISAAALALLLRTQLVQAQVQTLTSGTSSSHNRIKPRDLGEVVVPVPIAQERRDLLDVAAARYEESQCQYYKAISSMADSNRQVSRSVDLDQSTVLHSPPSRTAKS